jgi:hypothetical protein
MSPAAGRLALYKGGIIRDQFHSFVNKILEYGERFKRDGSFCPRDRARQLRRGGGRYGIVAFRGVESSSRDWSFASAFA